MNLSSNSGDADLHSEESRQRLEQVFRDAQIGQCVNSVAHDVNNYLGAIMAYSELIQLDSEHSDETLRMLDQITSAVRKASKMMRNLTDVARRRSQDIRIMDVSQVAQRSLDLIGYDMRTKRIEIETDFDEAPDALAMDLPRVQQAVMCMLQNAMEAVEGSQEPRVRVSANVSDADSWICIWNSGPCVEEAVRERIFEPFFTTKEAPHLGLGLALVSKIAADHEGEAMYDPERGFVMRLPMKNGYNVG
jgi:C4-dicarboxylate-specific signal transduction histidine kinase